MEEKLNTPPTAEKILTLLVELLADQHGVEIEYSIINEKGENTKWKTGRLRTY